jgi:predicted permease
MTAALLLLPDIALIVLGFVLVRASFVDKGFWPQLEKLIYFVLFPPLLFTSIARANLKLPGVTEAVFVAVAVTLLGILLGHGIAAASKAPRATGVSVAQCVYRYSAFVSIALSSRVYGQEGLALSALMMAIVVPIGNIAAVTALAKGAKAGVFKEIMLNPLILATAGGLVFNQLGGDLPEPLWVFLTRLGNASVALGLIAVGASLKFAVAHYAKLIAVLMAVKHLVMPAAAFGLVLWLETSGVARGMPVIFLACPTASSAYILAARMGGDPEAAAVAVSASTVAGMLVLPFWVALVT